MKRTGNSNQEQLLKGAWYHDVTNEAFTVAIATKMKSRKYKQEWFDATVSSRWATFKNDSGKKVDYTMTIPVRGINYPAVIVFDSEGKGVVFTKQ